jgi:hypothetical protein
MAAGDSARAKFAAHLWYDSRWSGLTVSSLSPISMARCNAFFDSAASSPT